MLTNKTSAWAKYEHNEYEGVTMEIHDHTRKDRTKNGLLFTRLEWL